jgi:hypothetical protein
MGNFLGEINRFQRLSGAINLEYDDNLQSSPIGLDLHFGFFACFYKQLSKDTKKRYGYNGNSFVCAVEFGPKIKAKSLLAEVTVAIQNQNTLTIKQPCIEKEI